ncbi:MAG: hypothetical protein A2Y38_16640 [Spirochaetes bacterium GWB1_59_5]|nr:MAG: hypothetical protein A2Y38_16640 [Spirochaetes bacterium GWB1_59_5]
MTINLNTIGIARWSCAGCGVVRKWNYAHCGGTSPQPRCCACGSSAWLPYAEDQNDSTNPKDKIGIKKPHIFTVPPAAIIYLTLAMQNGAEKYGAYNWRKKKVKASIYLSAVLRHILALIDGEDFAQDSGLPHEAHAMACLAILADARETGSLIDDRPVKGPAAELLKKWTKS